MAIITAQRPESRFQNDLRMGENTPASDSLPENAENQNKDNAPVTIEPRDEFAEERLQAQFQQPGVTMNATGSQAVAHAHSSACVIL
ncbi:hypothetical protein TWF694_008170 [Orbilia ellipsospora]|uniref:Uncharacterized protein n=1 Tax=Orbilia ellipsospora TaxID=2528407 RepID=A0AAV9XGA5_9PEZI